MKPKLLLFAFVLAVVCARDVCSGQSLPVIEAGGPVRPANGNGIYSALRNVLPAGDGLAVKGFSLEREDGTFRFEQGNFFLYGGINGQITGAVFLGKGHFELTPKEASEQHSLGMLSKNGVLSQDFSTLVLRFTDGTAEEIRKASMGSAGPVSSSAISAANELAKDFRERLHENLELRLLEDVLEAREGGFFLASLHMGGLLNGRNLLFTVDPESLPDQVELSTWSSDDRQVWAGYRMKRVAGGAKTEADSGVRAHGDISIFHVSNEKLDVAFDKSGEMHSTAETTVNVQRGGLRVVRLNLYPTLRVSGVYSETGQPLDFVQQEKDRDPQFAVILPKAVKAGETVRLLTKYGGKDALRRDGDGVYYLMGGARDSWYPAGNEALGGFAGFHMTFHLPKGLQIVATGKETSRGAESGGTRVVWETDAPIAVAGFNLGEFKSQDLKTPDGFDVLAYANVNLPDYVTPLSHTGVLGTLSAVPMLKDEVAQGSNAVQVYTLYFGKLPYDHVALTEQSACNYGQSWPMLVYLPICAFWDSTTQQFLGMRSFGEDSYWREVTPHEVSHQWWGTLIGFKSYRDQWMSEGFANFSVGLYLLETEKKMDLYRAFWQEQHDDLLHKNAQGVRPIDVGPLTMGARVSNEKTGNVYQKLIYSKGAYVMHMLEMMCWTPQYKSAPFRTSMHAFVAEYSGKAATTEDLKRSFERSMPKWLDIKGDGKLDWFFNEYVYGTELPHYTIVSDFTTTEGETSVHFKLTQSDVSKNFLMLVPIYLQMSDGSVVRIANMKMSGEESIERTYKLGKLASPGKKLLVNYNADILSD